MGRGGEHHAERSLRAGFGKGTYKSRRDPLSLRRRPAAAGNRHIHGVEALQIPMFGLFGACSTSGEALALAGMCAAAGYGKYMLAVTSSHFGSAEKEFRFPLGYASQRPLSAHWTVTGSGAFLVRAAEPDEGTKEKRGQADDADTSECAAETDVSTSHISHVRIAGVTVGKIVDYGLKDSQNMGACMAPAAMDTIVQNLSIWAEPNRIMTVLLPGIWDMWDSPSCSILSGKRFRYQKKASGLRHDNL